jgi:hypothetical protein
MGIFDLFSSKLTQEKFAKIFSEAARRQGFDTPMRFEAAEFRMLIDSDAIRVFNLNNAYRDYQAAPKAERETVLKRYTSSLVLPSIPVNFEAAKQYLMPTVRGRGQGEYLRLMGLAENGDKKHVDTSIHFSDDAVVMLAYDTEHSMSLLGHSKLEEWGITFEVALDAALSNLRDRTVEKFVDLGDGIILGQWNDAYDSSRIMLSDLVYRAAGGSDPIMMIPTRGCFLLTSSQSVASQLRMIACARKSIQEDGRFVSAAMYKFKNGSVNQYSPEDTVLQEALAELKKTSLADDYASQKNLLEKVHVARQEDVFVATYVLTKNNETGRITSHCSWSKGVISLLPKTELIAMVALGETEGDHKIKLMAWNDVIKIAGDLMKEVEGYPVRYLVKDFPATEILELAPTTGFKDI